MALKDLFKLRQKEQIPEGEPIGSETTELAEPKRILPVDEKVIRKATQILNEYKKGKTHLEENIKANEEFWKMRQWDRGVGGATGNESTVSTPWLHSCIESRHADAMDSYPTCNFRARQKDDEQEAKKLSAIVPVILEMNNFEETYDKVSRDTLIHGTGVYGIFWDPKKHNGLGDIAIRPISLLNLFFESGVTNIQASANVFYTSLVDDKVLEAMYPQTKHKLGGKSVSVAKFMYDDTVDTSGKSVVIDWYYHKINANGKKVLHFCKYVNDVVLFASENDPAYSAEGYYHHGLYPFEVQPLYPIEGSICGYGLTDIGKGTQLQIDRINKAIVDNAEEGSAARYFFSDSAEVSEEEFNDRTKKYVHVGGQITDNYIKPIDTPQLSGVYPNILQYKVDELKFCTANQDVNNGVAPSGVTSASGIAALQETSGKNARNSNRRFHRGYKGVVYQVVECMRQFYDQPRQFRIAPDSVASEYVSYSNAGLVPQHQVLAGRDMGFRVPEFDISITVEKANPYKKLENNELMLQFYGLGLFNPQNADQAVALLSNMDFDKKDELIMQIKQNGTMLDMLLRYQQIALQLASKVDTKIANQLASTIMQTNGGQSAPVSGTIDLGSLAPEEEHPFVERSRARARASTQAE